MLFDPSPTPYDVRFRLLGVPVRISPWFWLVAAIFGVMSVPRGPSFLPLMLVWVGCVLGSVLLHEMGHVLAGRLFGADGRIVLYSFGGLAIGSTAVRRRWQRVVVVLAGPGVQLALFAALYFLVVPRLVEAEPGRYVRFAVGSLLFINLAWPLLNLLPIWPLDGGQVTREVLAGLLPGRGLRVSLGASTVVAGLLAVNALAAQYARPLLDLPFLRDLGGIYLAMLFASLAVGSWQALQALPAEEDEKPEPAASRRDPYDDD